MGRLIAVVLGAWLFVSAFLWRHGSVHFHHAWLVGALVIALAVGWKWWAPARLLLTAAGIWLVLASIFITDPHPATLVNHMLVGLGVFAASTMPSFEARRRRVRATP